MIEAIKFFTKKLIHLFVIAPIRFLLISIRQNKGVRDKTIHSILWNEAIDDSAYYVKNFLPEVLLFDNKQAMWDFTIAKIDILGQCDILEFGCYKATSLNYFSTRLPNNKFYGFDNLMKNLIKNKQTINISKYKNNWLDIGRPSDYYKANKKYKYV